jgi:hypothetical protein
MIGRTRRPRLDRGGEVFDIVAKLVADALRERKDPWPARPRCHRGSTAGLQADRKATTCCRPRRQRALDACAQLLTTEWALGTKRGGESTKR